MTHDEILLRRYRNIYELLVAVSDAAYQMHIWSGGDQSVVQDYDEAMSDLFDGDQIEDFVTHDLRPLGISDDARSELDAFAKRLSAFVEAHPPHLEPEALNCMTEWKELVLEAKQVVGNLPLPPREDKHGR
jgi:hypothetical protein